MYAIYTGSAAAGEFMHTGFSYGFTFASNLTLHFIADGTAPPTGCTGGTYAIPQADPGHICLYESTTNLNVSSRGFNRSTRFGFTIFISSAAAGSTYSFGSWAATAP